MTVSNIAFLSCYNIAVIVCSLALHGMFLACSNLWDVIIVIRSYLWVVQCSRQKKKPPWRCCHLLVFPCVLRGQVIITYIWWWEFGDWGGRVSLFSFMYYSFMSPCWNVLNLFDTSMLHAIMSSFINSNSSTKKSKKILEKKQRSKAVWSTMGVGLVW